HKQTPVYSSPQSHPAAAGKENAWKPIPANAPSPTSITPCGSSCGLAGFQTKPPTFLILPSKLNSGLGSVSVALASTSNEPYFPTPTPPCALTAPFPPGMWQPP